MNKKYIFIGIIVVTVAVLAYLYWTKTFIENFTNQNNNLIFKPIDAISVIPDPPINPRRLAVVITKGKYIWKYKLIPKKYDDMTLTEKQMAGMQLYTGYPKLISEEFPYIDSYFKDGISAIANTIWKDNGGEPELQFHKNRYKYLINVKTHDKEIKMARSEPIASTDTSPIDLNDGFDSIISNPDYVFPNAQDTILRNYINNTYPNLSQIGGDYHIGFTGYSVTYDIFKDHNAYTLELRNQNGTKVTDWQEYGANKIRTYGQYRSSNDKLPPEIASLQLVNYQGYHHLALGNDIQNRIYSNDLYNCVFSVDASANTITRCTLWHQIKRSPRCAYSYPLDDSRQTPAYVYVFGKNKVWKYKPIAKREQLNTMLSLETGYPKTLAQEYPNLPADYQYYIDAVWYNNDILYFVKGGKVLKYNFKTQTVGTMFNMNTLFPDTSGKHIEAIVQTKEEEQVYLYLYSNNQYIKYSVGAYQYEKQGEWTNVPSNENRNDDFLMCGFYHPIEKRKVLTYMTETIMGDDTYHNENIFHAYTKTLILTDKASGAIADEQNHVLIQQTIMGEIKAFGFKLDNGKFVKIEDNDFVFKQFWDPIINKEIKEMCGIVHVPAFNNMRYVFSGDKFYSFTASGTYNNDNYNINLWAHNNNSDGQQSARNFDVESKCIPSDFDFCFEDTGTLVWFFKDGYCWKFNTSNRIIVDEGVASNFFTNFDVANESAIFDWRNNKVYFVKGNNYSLYNYNTTRSSLVSSNNAMYSMLASEIAQDTSKTIKVFSPISTQYAQAYEMTETSLNINSLHNFIENGNLMRMEQIDLGPSTLTPEITNEPAIVDTLPFEGKALKYTTTGGTVIDMTLNELYVSDIVFSFYIKKSPSTPAFEVSITTESEESTIQTLPVGNEWIRIRQYQWQNFDHHFKIKVTVPNGPNKTFYISGLQLENNLTALPFFTGRVFHTWDETDPPEIAYVYNVNYLSTVPPQQQGQLDIANMMSYNTLNQTRNDLGFEKEQAIHFDGKSVFMIIPTTSLKPTTVRNFSWSGWIRFRKFATPPSYQTIYGVMSPDGNFFYKVEESGGKVRIHIKNTQIEKEHTFQTVFIQANKWYFMALTINNNKLRFYAYNYYEEVELDTRLLDTDINTKIFVGVPVNYEQLMYKNYMLHADVGSISIWRRELTPNDIKILSRTYQDVKLALPEIKRKNLVGTGLAVPPLSMNISHVDGLGMCTYNCHIKWTKPKLPLDYKKLGFNIVKYETKIMYYVGGSLVEKNQLEPHIKAEKITNDVLKIKTFLPEIHCNDCQLSFVNIPYEYNYRIYVRYVLSNGEKSAWNDMDLKFKDNLVSRFGITGNTTCQYKVYQIDPKDKIKNEMKQNKFLDYSWKRLRDLKRF